MIKSGAIELLRTLSDEEMKEFGLFIRSPFFNREKVLIHFYETILKYHPYFDSRTLTKEKIFKKLYPGKKYNDGMMRNIFSKTLSLCEKFLTVNRFQQRPFDAGILLLEELSMRKSGKLFTKWEKEISGWVHNESTGDEDHYYHKILLGESRLQFEKNLKSNFSGSSTAELKMVEQNLVIQFLISIFKNVIHQMNEKKQMYLPDYDRELMEVLERYILGNRKNFESVIYLWYYFYSFKLASTLEEKYFFELRAILTDKHKELNYDDKRNIYTILTNYCYIKINKGDKSFTAQHLSLIKENVDQSLYLTGGNFMSHIFYMNAVIIALSEGDIDWTRDFLRRHKQELDTTNRDNTFYFAEALLHYHLKEYDKALEYAFKVKTIDLSYKHQLKSFYLKIYFDLKETEQFYSQVDSYRHFISSGDNTPKPMKEAINNYITFTKRLFDIKISGKAGDFEFEKLVKEVNGCPNLINKEWILNRIKPH